MTRRPRPINPSGESKLIFEQVLRWYSKIHGLTSVALCCFDTAGTSVREITAPCEKFSSGAKAVRKFCFRSSC